MHVLHGREAGRAGCQRILAADVGAKPEEGPPLSESVYAE